MSESGRRLVCVYCGSSSGRRPEFAAEAERLGGAIAAAGLGLVYGGGRVGLMGLVADAVMGAGAPAVGVIPESLVLAETGHNGLDRLEIVSSMHERKARMAVESDAFLALPGGLGTLEELAEIATWSQLGIHAKPVAVLDTDGFWTPFLGFLDAAVAAGFVKPEHRSIISRIHDVDDVLPTLTALAAAPRVPAGPLLGMDES